MSQPAEPVVPSPDDGDQPAAEAQGLHPWVAKARAIDRAAGATDLDAETLARFVRILRVATEGARRDARGRRRADLDERR
jgi:hypothetical protein